jgi:hypothetical protein
MVDFLQVLVAITSLIDSLVGLSPFKNKRAAKTKNRKMSEEDDYLGHPDSCIRLASAVHRFKVPMIDPDQKLSFAKSFQTTGTHPKTKTLMLKVGLKNRSEDNILLSFVSCLFFGSHELSHCLLSLLQADDARQKVASALEAQKVSHERVLNDSKRYLPFIHQILLSCKVQPEVARLDGKSFMTYACFDVQCANIDYDVVAVLLTTTI